MPVSSTSAPAKAKKTKSKSTEKEPQVKPKIKKEKPAKKSTKLISKKKAEHLPQLFTDTPPEPTEKEKQLEESLKKKEQEDMIANLLVVGGIVLALYGAYTLWKSKQVSVTDAEGMIDMYAQ
jgi:hypothetical protein